MQKTGTNAAWKAKNISDLAGNAWEWTMMISLDGRAKFGHSFTSSGCSAFENDWQFAYLGEWDIGFRPALYII